LFFDPIYFLEKVDTYTQLRHNHCREGLVCSIGFGVSVNVWVLGVVGECTHGFVIGDGAGDEEIYAYASQMQI